MTLPFAGRLRSFRWAGSGWTHRRRFWPTSWTTLLSRAEIRDLVDVAALEREGYRVEDALALARNKDAGLTPGQLSWVLSQIQIRDGARLPGGTDASVLRAFLADLCGRLNRLAFP
jgi:hypothetical protein